MKSPLPRWVLPSALCAVAFAAVVLASVGPTDADVLTGRIYPLEDRGGQPLFTWQFERDVVVAHRSGGPGRRRRRIMLWAATVLSVSFWGLPALLR
jgi:hypothetical protein